MDNEIKAKYIKGKIIAREIRDASDRVVSTIAVNNTQATENGQMFPSSELHSVSLLGIHVCIALPVEPHIRRFDREWHCRAKMFLFFLF